MRIIAIILFSLIVTLSCNNDKGYEPNDNETSYLHENIEEFAPDVINNKIDEVENQSSKKLYQSYSCDAPIVEMSGFVYKEDMNVNTESGKNTLASFYFLKLYNACNIFCNDNGQNKSYKYIETIQINFNDNLDKSKIVGKNIKIKGQLFGAKTAFHKTPVLISTKSIEFL